jgi:hypothetical protein
MSDTTRRPTPDERVHDTIPELLVENSSSAPKQYPNISHSLAHVTTDCDTPKPINPTSTESGTHLDPQSYLNQLVQALDSTDESIKSLINQRPNTWQAINPKVITLTKKLLKQSSWGTLRVADDL